MILQKLKTDAEAYLGEKITEAVITVPGLLRRHAAPGHQGRRPHRRPRRQAHHQRAHRLGPGLRPGQEEGREDRRLRPGRRHLRHLDPGAGRRRLRGQGHQRRHPPGRRRLRPARHRLAADRVQEGPGHRPAQGPAGPAAPQGSRREGQDRAVHDGTRPRSTCPTSRPTRPNPKHLVMTLTRAKLEELVADLIDRTRGPVEAALKDAGLKPADIDEVILVGGQTRMPAVQEAVKAMFGGKEPHKGVNPDEVVADRRRDPGRRAGRRGQGRPAARRHAAVAGHRDPGRRDDQAHRAQHHHPDLQEPGVLDRQRQPAAGRDPRAPGRARDGRRQQDAGQVHPRRHPAGSARRARRSRSPSTSTPTASST